MAEEIVTDADLIGDDEPNPNRIYTPEGAGIRLGGVEDPIPVTTLQWWRTTGRGPEYEKRGKRVVYRESALAAFEAKGKRAGGTNRVQVAHA